MCLLVQECQELQLFQAVLAWLMAVREEEGDRNEAAAQLLPLIRFPLMSVADLQAGTLLFSGTGPLQSPAAIPLRCTCLGCPHGAAICQTLLPCSFFAMVECPLHPCCSPC